MMSKNGNAHTFLYFPPPPEFLSLFNDELKSILYHQSGVRVSDEAYISRRYEEVQRSLLERL